MNTNVESSARPASTAAAARLDRLRRGNFAVLVLLVVEFTIGTYTELYVTIPEDDHGGGLGSAISNGPWTLSTHAVLGLLLGLGALGVLVQAIMLRRPAAIALSAVGLFALAAADAAGTEVTSGGDRGASMAMAVFTAVALLCCAVNLYLTRPRDGRH